MDETLTSFHRSLTARLQDVRSTRQLGRHPDFLVHRETLEQVFRTVEVFEPAAPPEILRRDFIRVAAWNIERGLAYKGILDTLKHHPILSQSDIFLLTEVDHGMARSGNRHVTRDLVKDLGLYGVFGAAYLNLDKGNGAEASAAGENTVALQGHAILSRYPLSDAALVPLPNAKDHMAGRERQIGRENAVVATAQTPLGPLHFASVHLAAHSARRHRVAQMKALLGVLSQRSGPAVIGGDWNTSTYNAHNARRAIIGFWRRVAMGVRHTTANHYPYPERYFEKPLFSLLEKHGFETDGLNVPGGCTLHYDFNDPFLRASMSDWLPDWCFKYIDWALKPRNGLCSFKLDWLAGRGVKAREASVIGGLPRGAGRYSDHDPIIADVFPETSYDPAS